MFNCPYIMSGMFIKGDQIYPCCHIDHRVQRTSIIDYNNPIYNNQILRNIRKDAMSGTVPDICKSCVAKEDQIGTSPRLKAIEKLDQLGLPNVELDEYTTADQMFFCNVRLHNICNFKCTICFPSSSHLIGKELGRVNVLNKLNEQYYDKLTNELNTFKNLIHVRIAGGEPLYMKKELCSFLNNLDRRFTIGITTNGSVYDEEIINLLSEFKTVYFTFSIDGIGKFFEYQRANGVWDEVYQNLMKYKSLPQPFNFTLGVTVTNITLSNVPSLIRFMHDELPNWVPHTGFYSIKSPEYYQIKLLKDDIIEQYAQEIENLGYEQFANDVRSDIGQCVSKELIKSFWDRADYIKQYRNQDINNLGIIDDFKSNGNY